MLHRDRCQCYCFQCCQTPFKTRMPNLQRLGTPQCQTTVLSKTHPKSHILEHHEMPNPLKNTPKICQKYGGHAKLNFYMPNAFQKCQGCEIWHLKMPNGSTDCFAFFSVLSSSSPLLLFLASFSACFCVALCSLLPFGAARRPVDSDVGFDALWRPSSAS